jgi:regulator of sigma E protease
MTAEERAVTLAGKSVGQRAAIVAAGPIANFILSIAIFAVLAMFVGKAEIAPRVERVVPGGAAERAGVLPGDLFVSLNGSKISSFSDLQRIIHGRALERLPAVIDRDGKRIALELVPEQKEQTSRLGTMRIGLVGIEASRRAEDRTHRKFGPLEALGIGVSDSWHVIERSISYLGKLLVGKESTDQLSGPIRIAQVSGEVASSSGLLGLISLVAILSVSIGMINLFPIPMLDGGHLLFYLAEWVRGRPLGERAQEWGFRAGIAFVMMMTVFVTWNDLVHLVQLWRN